MKKREEFDELIEKAVPPFWFWPERDDWERKYGWAVSNTSEASARFNEMFDRLKKFVDEKQLKADGTSA